MRFIIQLIFTILIYCILAHTIYSRIAVQYDHEEMALYGSLLCYSCIGVE